MSKSARWVYALIAVVPASAVLALDPTLPQPGRSRSTPNATPATPASVNGNPTAAVAATDTPATSADTTPIEATPTDRVPIPDAQAQADAQKLVAEIYKQQLSVARTPDAKKQLATDFRTLAASSQPPGKYVLLLRARELAADAGDVSTALGTVADLERAFLMDGVSLELDAVNRMLRVIRSTDGFKAMSRHLLGSANQAVAGNRFESARKLIDQAVTLSVRSNDAALTRMVTTRAKEVREIEANYLSAKQALDAVIAKTADPSQYLTAGRYKALYQGDFTAGLPLLTAGADDPLKDLAAKEIAGVNGADQQDAMGDAWYGAAEKLTGVAKNNAIRHAGTFYAQAAPSISGLQQVKATRRAKEGEALAAMYAGRPASANADNTGPVAATPNPPGPGSTPMPPPTPPVPPTTNGTGAPAGKVDLPSKFTRVWKSPEVWQNKPEDVTLKAGRVSIMNEGGSNTVCENEPLVPQGDGSLVLSWDYGPEKTGYEIWTVKDGQLIINRWNSKAELDSGRPVRRVGTIAK